MSQPGIQLLRLFLNAAEHFEAQIAAEVGAERWSYRKLRDVAASLAATLDSCANEEPRMTGIYASRSMMAYGGVMAALFRGHAYVPLNPADPPERTVKLLNQ